MGVNGPPKKESGKVPNEKKGNGFGVKKVKNPFKFPPKRVNPKKKGETRGKNEGIKGVSW